MKDAKLVLTLILLSSPIMGATVDYRDLDPDVVQKLPVAYERGTTTLFFPSPIEAIRARHVATDPKQKGSAQFLLSYTPGQNYLSLIALVPNAQDFLTVIYEGTGYTFDIFAAKDPVISLNCKVSHQAASYSTTASVSPARLISILDTAKAYQLLKQTQSDQLQGVSTASPQRITKMEGYQITLQQVWRFDKEDTLVFWVQAQNFTAKPIYYDPSSPLVRLQSLLFTPSITDATGVLPPGMIDTQNNQTIVQPGPIVDIFFAVTATPNGGRNELLPDNEWNVILPRLDYRPNKPKSK